MLLKLSKLKMPLKFEQISNIAGIGVAPGRLHVARAMVEAGYVENLKQAFSRYLYDGGPAYATYECYLLIRESFPFVSVFSNFLFFFFLYKWK